MKTTTLNPNMELVFKDNGGLSIRDIFDGAVANEISLSPAEACELWQELRTAASLFVTIGYELTRYQQSLTRVHKVEAQRIRLVVTKNGYKFEPAEDSPFNLTVLTTPEELSVMARQMVHTL